MTVNFTQRLLYLTLPFSVFVLLIVLSRSHFFLTSGSELALGVTLDFLITIPLLYFIAIRKTTIPKFTVLSVFVIIVLMASFVLPAEKQAVLLLIKNIAIPVVEICLIIFLMTKANRIRKEMGIINGHDFYDSIKIACSSIFPSRFGELLSIEIAVIYYAFFSNQNPIHSKHDYTYHEKSGIKTTIGVFIFLVLIETMVVHILIQQWNVTVAWVLSFIGVYTCLQIFGLMRSLNKRLISFDYINGEVNLKYGFFNQTSIPFDLIMGIESNRRSLPKDKMFVKLSPLDMLDVHNIFIHLKSPLILNRMYGLKKDYKSIAIFVDDKDQFVNEVKEIIRKRKCEAL